MNRLRDLNCEVKPARTMCHGKSGWDPLSPSMSQAGRVKPLGRECRHPKSGRKLNSIPSFRHRPMLARRYSLFENANEVWRVIAHQKYRCHGQFETALSNLRCFPTHLTAFVYK